MTYYLYHIPGKKIGVTRDLKYRVEEQQGYGPGEYDIIMKSDNKDYVSEQELARAKVRARGNLIRELDSNMGLALLMAYFHVLKGDWRERFHSINQINNVTPEDIKRVANKYLVTNNRTIASIVTMGSNPTER